MGLTEEQHEGDLVMTRQLCLDCHAGKRMTWSHHTHIGRQQLATMDLPVPCSRNFLCVCNLS